MDFLYFIMSRRQKATFFGVLYEFVHFLRNFGFDDGTGMEKIVTQMSKKQLSEVEL
jgi:hypothetical protein